ncbi:MAG: hypothetical protein AB1752_00555, partial [Candidatus Zixiibacteriota bacterium]
VSRGGATVCDGDGYGGALGQYGSFYYGDEFYAAFQDPESFGSCAGGSGLYTYDVTSVKWWTVNNTPAYHEFQPIVWENGGDAICPIPGAVLCAGPLYVVDFTGMATGGYILDLPFPTECCSYDPYFAGFYAAQFVGAGYLGIVVDNDGASACWQYNDWSGTWDDLTAGGFVGDMFLWSEGVGYDQNTCPGTPGLCDWQVWNDGGVTYIWHSPRTNGMTDYYVRFTADVSCTLNAAQFLVYGATTTGTPTVRVSVYGGNGPIFAGRMYPDCFGCAPGTGPNYLGSIDVPFVSLSFFPAYTVVDLTPLGPLEFGPSEEFFVSVALSPATPTPGTDLVTFLSDDETGAVGRSGVWKVPTGIAPAGPDWFYFTEYYAAPADFEMFIEAFVCCEQVELVEEACAAPGPDDWNTWAHDYQRTSASSMDLGDPCQVTAAWYQPLNTLNNFNEPTIAGDRVYVNTDTRLSSFDLQTGAPGNFISGTPNIFGSNRGNTTVEGGFAYVTGGTARSISQWVADLSVRNWINGLPALGAGPLSANVRFGVTAVYNIGPDEVVVVGDDAGRLYCYLTSTGALYPGWAPNPVILPAGSALHSPAYDGAGTLYVGTAAAATNQSGAIYSINAATGAINWTYDDANFADEGYPGGVSYEGGFVYANSNAAGASALGARIKLDATGAEVWKINNARSLYGAPTIGRKFLYIGQDIGGQGLLVVDKNSGAALYNFALDGVGDVTQHATILCDNYIFVGDRNGHWWLLDANDFTPEWYFAFFGIVNGTAIGQHSVSGDGFAVVSVRTDASSSTGAVAAFKFNAGARPRVRQDVFLTSIPIPFGTGPGNPYTELGVLANVGCAPLNITATNVYDTPIDVVASNFHKSQDAYAAAQASLTVGADYNAYFDVNNMSKSQRIAYNKVMPMVDHELSRFNVENDKALAAMETSKRADTRMAAGASITRTSAVTTTTPVAVGGTLDVSWLYDGSGLERGLDVEIIEFITDDPDYAIIVFHDPYLEVDYIGGCLEETREIVWNTLGAQNSELIINNGRMGYGTGDDADLDLDWDGAHPNYDGAFYFCGDSSATAVQFHTGGAYNEPTHARLFLPNPLPSLGGCGIDGAADVHLGYKREGGCPGTPTEILGEWVRSAYVDSNETALPGTPAAAIGTIITQTEVGSYDPLYGDFKLIRWEFENRDAVAKGPLHAGTMFDWDVDAYAENHGIARLSFNGYAIWDWATPGLAFGMLDPNQPSTYTGVDPTAFPPRVIREAGEGIAYDIWQTPGTNPELWYLTVNQAPLIDEGSDLSHRGFPGDLQEDHQGYLTNGAFNLPASGTAAIHQALFAVDATSGAAAVEASAMELAARAAKWGGFARGDVNDDGVINLVDVCWLMGTNQIYPDDYNGDVNVSGGVDGADETYLLNYVSGLGPAPQGEWRFTF